MLFCHWHTFAVLFDETSSSPVDWKTQLSSTKVLLQPPASASTEYRASEGDDYESGEEYDYDTHPPVPSEGSPDLAPSLQPTFHSVSSRKHSQSVFKALNEIAQSTRGVVVLLCSEPTDRKSVV